MPQLTNPFTFEAIEVLRKLCDHRADKNDTGKQLRWKAAQREIYLTAKTMYEKDLAQATARHGVTTRSDD